MNLTRVEFWCFHWNMGVLLHVRRTHIEIVMYCEQWTQSPFWTVAWVSEPFVLIAFCFLHSVLYKEFQQIGSLISFLTIFCTFHSLLHFSSRLSFNFQSDFKVWKIMCLCLYIYDFIETDAQSHLVFCTIFLRSWKLWVLLSKKKIP